MATAKYYKREAKDISPLEVQVANALIDIESLAELKAELKGLTLSKAKELKVAEGQKNAILVFVPFHHLKLVHSHYKKLSIEFEKRLKTTVLLIITRTIQSRWIKLRKSLKRPHNRTLTAVHEAILDDLVLPGTIIGKRTRVRLDGSSFLKVTLDRNEQHNIQERVQAIRAAYQLLTNKHIEIDFAQDPVYHVLRTRKTN